MRRGKSQGQAASEMLSRVKYSNFSGPPHPCRMFNKAERDVTDAGARVGR